MEGRFGSAYAGGSVDVNVGFHDSSLESCLAAFGQIEPLDESPDFGFAVTSGPSQIHPFPSVTSKGRPA